MKSIPHLVFENCKRFAERAFIYYKDENVYKHFLWKDLKVNLLKYSYFLNKTLNLKTNDKLAIISENRPEWLYFDIASQSIGVVPVPLYTSSTNEQIFYILKKSKAKVLVVSKKVYLEKILDFSSKMEDLHTIICIEDFSFTASSKFKIIKLKDLIKDFDLDLWNVELEKNIDSISSQAVASIIFTSGTCADSKGVMLTHENIITNVLDSAEHFKITSNDMFFSILPLSHIYERTCGQFVPLIIGCSLAYGESIVKFVKNLSEVNPTICPVVPRLLEKAYSKILKTGEKANLFKKIIFNFAISSLKNRNTFLSSIKFKLADILVFRKIRKLFGKNLRFMVAGGAALDTKCQKFFNDIGIVVLEGYGLTETSPVIAASQPDDFVLGSVGKVLPSVQVKLSAEHEILVKGKSVMKGYFEEELATKNVFDADGWFKTGDMGFIDEQGFLFIKGRIKDIIVTTNGKNIYPVSIEKKLESTKYIEQACLTGDNKAYVSALIVPSFENIEYYAKRKRIKFKDKEDLLSKVKIQDLIFKSVNEVNNNLASYERIKKYKILLDPFTEETGELTSTLKIKRRIINEKYKNLIESM